jgi:hypothetical protein
MIMIMMIKAWSMHFGMPWHDYDYDDQGMARAGGGSGSCGVAPASCLRVLRARVCVCRVSCVLSCVCRVCDV